MIKSYRIVDGYVKKAEGSSIPDGFTEYTVGQEPAELKALLDEEALKKLVADGEALVEAHIQEPIDAYNKAHSVKFRDAHSCANYKDEATYPHHLFCADAWAFNVAVWEASRAIQVQVFTEVIPQPTAEEFKAMLPVYAGVV